MSAKFIGPSDRQDKYVIGPICLISSRTEMSDVASSTMYTIFTQESDRYMFGPMKCFSKQDRMSYEVLQSFADTEVKSYMYSYMVCIQKAESPHPQFSFYQRGRIFVS